jgi:tetratricopeptide (TPR) repeat protein
MSPEVQELRRQAVNCLEESLRLAPGHLPTYQSLLAAYREWKEPAQEVETARRLVAAFPEDFETLLFLASHHFRQGEPDQAIDFAQRARALKPLDEAVLSLEWSVQIALARQQALQKQWDQARSAFEAANRLRPEAAQEFTTLAKRAIMERKAGEKERAEELIQKAEASLAEPTPLWLALHIEAVRYRLPKPEKDRFAKLWKDAIKRKCRSETAGAIASLLAAYLAMEVEYTGRAGHLKDAVAYLRRTSRIKYRMEDLVDVCGFLANLPQESALFKKMVDRGIKNFPNVPTFWMLLGTLELQKGPMRGSLYVARTQFEMALKYAEASAEPRDQALIPKIRERLSMLSALMSNPLGMIGSPFFGGPGFPMPSGSPPGSGPHSPLEDLFDMLDFDEDDDWDDDDWGDSLPFPFPMPPAQPPPPSSKRKAGKSQSKGKKKRKR